MKPKYVYIILAAIIICGFAYRIYDLGHDSYWIDESYTVLASKNIGEYNYPRFDSGMSYWGGFPQLYALFGIGEIFGYGHVPMRILSVLFGCAFIFLIFLLVKKQFDARVALLSAFFVAFSYFEIAWSRQARGYIFLEFFVFLALYAYILFLKKYEVKYLLLVLVSALLAISFNPIALLFPVILFLHYLISKNVKLIYEFFHIIKNLIINKWLFLGVIVSLCVLSYLLFHLITSVDIVANYFSSYISFFFGFHFIFVFLAVIGFFAFRKNLNNSILYLFIILFVVLGASYFVQYLNFRYVFIALPALYILASIGILFIYDIYSHYIYKLIVLIFFVLLLLFSNFLFFPKSSYALETGTPQPPFKEAYDYVELRISNNETLIVTQPAISELYFRKADYWLGIAYENRGISHLYDSDGRELYTGILTINNTITLDEVLNNRGFIVIDDMGINRISPEIRLRVLNLTMEKEYGDRFWNKVYVYSFGKNINK